MIGQVETALPDGRRLISAGRSIEDGARGVLLLDPGRVRVDVTPREDMFQLSVRCLSEGGTVLRRSLDRPVTVLTSAGVERLELPLLGAAALELEWDERVRYALRLGSVRNAATGKTTFTVQAVVSDLEVSPPRATPGSSRTAGR